MRDGTVPVDGGPLVHRLEQMCSVCDGTGSFPDPAWETWDHEDRALAAELLACEDQPVLARVIQARRDAHWEARPASPRDMACPECEGVGTVPNEDGVQLLTFVLRHLRR